jgi:2,4-dienoyl-CoA reductase-like NADH-dependent reductase (Old Yellow Enzyme family)
MAAPLFAPLTIRGVTLRNRIGVSPMCQYSSVDGHATHWHLVHLGSRAVGGAGLVFTEATAVTANGRISPGDLGIYSDDHCEMLEVITTFVRRQGAVPGIQLGHAGRKASTARPWDGRRAVRPEDGGWEDVVAPSAVPFSDVYPVPHALDRAGIGEIVEAFGSAARRALEAGFQVAEIHAAHGYVLHEFLSPLSNLRTDGYGGSFDNRIRIVLDTVAAVRSVWPDSLPVFIRISATDWVDGGWTPDETVELARRVAALGVDVVDCSSGGNVPDARIPIGPGYQVPFAERVRREAGVTSAAVGMIADPAQANAIVRDGRADIVLLAREELRDPYWPLRAARELGVAVDWPIQYHRAR